MIFKVFSLESAFLTKCATWKSGLSGILDKCKGNPFLTKTNYDGAENDLNHYSG